MSDAVGAFFPYVRLWAKNGRELSIEHYYGAPSVCFLPGADFTASLPSLASELHALDYDPEIISLHVLLPKQHAEHASAFRAQNVKIIENELLTNLDLAFSLTPSDRPWIAIVLDPQGRIVSLDESPSVASLFAQGTALVAARNDAVMVRDRHAPVIVVRSCVSVNDLPADLMESAEQRRLVDFDYELFSAAATLIHKSYNFHVTRRSAIQVLPANDEAITAMNRRHRYSRFTCVIAGDMSSLQLSFPEFSRHYYQLGPGDALIFPSNLCCQLDSEASSGELITLRFFDDASSPTEQDDSDKDHFTSDAIERVYSIYIDGQPDIMPSYSVDDSSAGVE